MGTTDNTVIGMDGVIGTTSSLMETIAMITLAAAAKLKTMFSLLVMTEMLHSILKTAVIKVNLVVVIQTTLTKMKVVLFLMEISFSGILQQNRMVEEGGITMVLFSLLQTVHKHQHRKIRYQNGDTSFLPCISILFVQINHYDAFRFISQSASSTLLKCALECTQDDWPCSQ